MFEKIIPHTATPERPATAEGNFYEPKHNKIGPGMSERVQKLRKLSVETEPSLSIERALHETAFYKEIFYPGAQGYEFHGSLPKENNLSGRMRTDCRRTWSEAKVCTYFPRTYLP